METQRNLPSTAIDDERPVVSVREEWASKRGRLASAREEWEAKVSVGSNLVAAAAKFDAVLITL
jgi:hypothetical protein